MPGSMTLILGGVRSGKSRLAEEFASRSGLPVTYIATATIEEDPEMQQRVAGHRAQRPAAWQLVEEPLHLGAALERTCAEGRCVLVDCLTLWLTNLLLADDPDVFLQERQALLAALTAVRGEVLLVSNETNMGITPLGALSRRYCDEAGWLHQALAKISDKVILTVAGLPHYLKGSPDG